MLVILIAQVSYVVESRIIIIIIKATLIKRTKTLK